MLLRMLMHVGLLILTWAVSYFLIYKCYVALHFIFLFLFVVMLLSAFRKTALDLLCVVYQASGCVFYISEASFLCFLSFFFHVGAFFCCFCSVFTFYSLILFFCIVIVLFCFVSYVAIFCFCKLHTLFCNISVTLWLKPFG